MDSSGKSTLVRFTDSLRSTEGTPQESRDQRGDEVPPKLKEAPEESFGTWLRRQRESKGVRLHEIADASKISLRYLKAFEEDRFEVLPAPVFARGFLRQYAEHVGLDPDQVLSTFLAVGHESEAEEEPAPLPPRARPQIANWIYGVAVGVVILLMIALVSWLSHLRDDSVREPAAVAESTDVPEAPASGSEMPGGEAHARSPTAGEAPSELPAAPLVVTLDFTGECWVGAAVDGEMQIDEIKIEGESLRIEAQEGVDLKLGNSTVVEAQVNGYPFPLQTRANTTVWNDRIDLETARTLAQEEN